MALHTSHEAPLFLLTREGENEENSTLTGLITTDWGTGRESYVISSARVTLYLNKGPTLHSDTRWIQNEHCWNNTDTATLCQFVHNISQSDRSGVETRYLCWEIWSVVVQRYTLSAVLTSDMMDCCRCNSAQEEVTDGRYQTGADTSLVKAEAI